MECHQKGFSSSVLYARLINISVAINDYLLKGIKYMIDFFTDNLNVICDNTKKAINSAA